MKSRLLIFLLSVAALGAQAQADFRVDHVLPGPYLKPGTYTFIPGIENLGPQGAGLRVWWQLDNGPVKNVLPKTPGGLVGNNPVTKIESDSFRITLSTVGTSRLKIWTTITNGVTESNPKNDTLVQVLKVMNNLPDKHVILEVYKHQRCGPCLPAAEYNKVTIDPMPNYSTVNLYTDPTDLLYNSDAAAINTVYGFAHPAPVFDRFRFKYLRDITTGYFTINNVYSLRELGRRDIQFEPLEVGVAAMSLDTTARLLNVRLRATVVDTMSGDLRFNLWITEDSVKGYQAEAPNPNDYWHSHVLRHFAGGQWGKQGSLPAKLVPGQTYTQDFQYTIPVAYKLRHLHAIGLVQVYHKDSMARRILNSVDVKATKKLGVGQRSFLSDVVAYPVPAHAQLRFRINSTLRLEDMRLTIRTIQGQLIREQAVSAHEHAVSLQDLAPGTYTWTLQSPDGSAGNVFTKQ